MISSAALIKTLTALGTLLLATGTGYSVTVTSNFSDATGTSSGSVDAYPGQAGNGWAGAWSARGTTIAGTVVDTMPLNGGGNYLAADAAGTASGKAMVRQLNAAVIDPNQPYSLEWTFRLDSALTTFTSFNDRIAFFGDSTALTSSAASNSWLIGVGAADNGTSQTVYDGNWYFFDYGSSNTFVVANMVDTGISLTSGTVYTFSITVNPATRSYSATIGNGTTTFSRADMTFRNNSTTATPYLHFGVNTSAEGETAAFSLDSVKVTGVPEPATGLLVLGGLGLCLGRRRR